MREFRIGKSYYISGLVVLLICLVIMSIVNDWFSSLVLSAFIIIAIIDSIRKVFVKYIVDDIGISKKTLTNTQILIHWNQVKAIAKAAHAKEAVIVVADNRQFIINKTISNYKEMINAVIEESKNYRNISVDSKILDSLK